MQSVNAVIDFDTAFGLRGMFEAADMVYSLTYVHLQVYILSKQSHTFYCTFLHHTQSHLAPQLQALP